MKLESAHLSIHALETQLDCLKRREGGEIIVQPQGVNTLSLHLFLIDFDQKGLACQGLEGLHILWLRSYARNQTADGKGNIKKIVQSPASVACPHFLHTSVPQTNRLTFPHSRHLPPLAASRRKHFLMLSMTRIVFQGMRNVSVRNS